jgi:hypothetical protein
MSTEETTPTCQPDVAHARAIDLHAASDAQLALICGELTAGELRTIRAILNHILLAQPKKMKKPSTDTEMLNWLDKQGAHYKWKVQLPTDNPNVKDAVFVCRNTTSGHKTIREAIDAAMKVRGTVK